jgi:hypothetical protein
MHLMPEESMHLFYCHIHSLEHLLYLNFQIQSYTFHLCYKNISRDKCSIYYLENLLEKGMFHFTYSRLLYYLTLKSLYLSY